jgi:hypothetical protein
MVRRYFRSLSIKIGTDLIHVVLGKIPVPLLGQSLSTPKHHWNNLYQSLGKMTSQTTHSEVRDDIILNYHYKTNDHSCISSKSKVLNMQHDTLSTCTLMHTSLIAQSRHGIPHISTQSFSSADCYAGLPTCSLDDLTDG